MSIVAVLAVVGVGVSVGVGVGMSESGKATAQAMIESSRIKSKADLDGIVEQQDTEKKRIVSEKKQADDWLAYDKAESKADRQEAIAFQKKMDQSMGVYQDEQHIQRGHSNHNFSEHQYPTPVSDSGTHAHA